jgi:hypothetical protein
VAGAPGCVADEANAKQGQPSDQGDPKQGPLTLSRAAISHGLFPVRQLNL